MFKITSLTIDDCPATAFVSLRAILGLLGRHMISCIDILLSLFAESPKPKWKRMGNVGVGVIFDTSSALGGAGSGNIVSR